MKEKLPRQEYAKIAGIYTESFELAPVIETQYGNVSLASDIGYRKERNEDRVFLDTQTNLFGVVDGIGGYERGDEAAEIVCQQVVSGIKKGIDTRLVQHQSATTMRSQGILMGGACYAYFQVIKKELHASWAGDVKIIVFDERGEITYETKSTDIGSAPRGQSSGNASVDVVDFMNNQIAVAASDGLWDNVAISEVQRLVSEARTGETNILLKSLYDLAMQGMQEGFMTNYQETAPDERMNYGKPDNIGIVVFQKLSRG